MISVTSQFISCNGERYLQAFMLELRRSDK